MEKEELTIKLETLTPIWTGNAFGKSEDIKESSIIGSIRWWYEIVNKGLGRNVCNPISDNNKCKLNSDVFADSIVKGKTVDEALDQQQICSVCKLFGCNGWSGKIRMVIEDEGGIDVGKNIFVEGRKFKKTRRNVQGKVFNRKNPLELHFYSIKEVTNDEWRTLYFTLKLIFQWMALGARTAQGNGVVKITSDFLEKNKTNLNSIEKFKKDLKHPNVNNFFFLKFQLKFNKNISSLIASNTFWTKKGAISNSNEWMPLWGKYSFIPIAFHIRDTIRRIEKDDNKRHELFGEVSRKCRKGSQIFVSHGYRINDKTVEFRIWGYGIDANKNGFVSQIIKQLECNLERNLFVNKEKSKAVCNLIDSIYGEELLEKWLEEVK